MPGPANLFDAIISDPTLQNTMAGAVSGGGQQYINPAILHAAATGEVETQIPRTGLGALAAKMHILSPMQQVDPQTIDWETIVAQRKQEIDQSRKEDALIKFANLVKTIGGDNAIKVASQFFGPALTDPNVIQAFAHIKAASDLTEEKLEVMRQGMQSKMDIMQSQLDERVRHDDMQNQLYQARTALDEQRSNLTAQQYNNALQEINLKQQKLDLELRKFESSPGAALEKSIQAAYMDPMKNTMFDNPDKVDALAQQETNLGITNGFAQQLKASRAAMPAGTAWPAWVRTIGNAIFGGGGTSAAPPAPPAAPATAPTAGGKPKTPPKAPPKATGGSPTSPWGGSR